MRQLTALLIIVCSLLLNPTTGSAVLRDTFKVRAVINLCPEYPLGGVRYEVRYRIGDDTTELVPSIVSQTVDTDDNTATVDLLLPATYATTDLHVYARCSNSFGTGAASAEQDVSNCDYLATVDTDSDGIIDSEEDSNCSNLYEVTDYSDADNPDTDGDGFYDVVERILGTSLTHPGSSPRKFVYKGEPFDPDSDLNANPVAWRETNGFWYIRDFNTPGNHIAFQFGLPGDIPFTYKPKALTSNVGVIRPTGPSYVWYFNGAGFQLDGGGAVNLLNFGQVGDSIVVGPWEDVDATSPAVSRLYNGLWYHLIYLRSGVVRIAIWGVAGDLLRHGDYDGDGLWDFAVFRPTTSETYVARSSDNAVETIVFGTGSSDLRPRGDYTGDGKADIVFWEPINGIYSTLTSDNGLDPIKGAAKDPDHYEEIQLGLYFIHMPLPYNRQGGLDLYTVVDHSLGLRYWREDNVPSNPVQAIQWGLPVIDHLG